MDNLEKQLEELIKLIAKDIKQLNEIYFGPSTSGSTTQNIDETNNF
jgi:hypothetical protein